MNRQNNVNSRVTTMGALLRMPRLGRIVVITVTTLLAAFNLSYITADLHWRFFFTMDTLAAPLIVTGLGALVLYVAGWLLVVGTAGEQPQPRPVTRWYFIITLLIIVVGKVWMLANVLPTVFG